MSDDRNTGALPVSEQCRVILDNDWAGDPDGLVALAHHLLSPTNRVVLVTSSFLDPMLDPRPDTADRGASLARELIDLIDPPAAPRVVTGTERALGSDRSPSAAAAAIVEEAMRDDPSPLMLVCGGPLTNVAEAFRAAPEIVARLTLVWIGGSRDGNAFEYNRDTDRAAADAVLAEHRLRFRQFPLETYQRCAYSIAELENDLAGCGDLGRWLWNRFVTLPLPEGIRIGGVWPLGDSPPLLITALTDQSSTFVAAADGDADRRIYTDIDVRLLFGDMLARFRLHARRAAG